MAAGISSIKSEPVPTVDMNGGNQVSAEQEVIERALKCGLEKQVNVTKESTGRQRKINLRRLMELAIDKDGLRGWSSQALLEFEPMYREQIRTGVLTVGREPNVSWRTLGQLVTTRSVDYVTSILNWAVSVGGTVTADEEPGGFFDEEIVFDVLRAGRKVSEDAQDSG